MIQIAAEKQRIARVILEALPEWFGILNLPMDSITNILSDCTPVFHNPVGAFRRKADNKHV